MNAKAVIRPVTAPRRDVLTPREVADRAGFSYHAILRAIRRGDLEAFEPCRGHYRIELDEYERWLHTPARRRASRRRAEARPRRRASWRGRLIGEAWLALRAIEARSE